MVEELNIVRIAEERASAYAPRPKQAPVVAGMLSGLAAYLLVFVFAAAANIETSRYSVAHIITVAIAFGTAYAYVRHQERVHNKAVAKEIERLEKENNA